MQRGSQRFFKKRAIYYASRQISGQSSRGRNWEYNFTEIYVIAILENFTLDGTRSSKYLHDIGLSDRESGQIFHEGYGFIFVELLNFTKSEKELETELDKWLYALKNMSRLTEVPATFKGEIFNKLFDTAEYINLTPMERTMYDIKQKIEWDNKNVHDFAMEEAELKGKERGEQIGEYSMATGIARSMKKDGVSLETIIKYTNLQKEEIELL